MASKEEIEKYFDRDTSPNDKVRLKEKITKSELDMKLQLEIGEAVRDNLATKDLRKRLSNIAIESRSKKNIYMYFILKTAAVFALLILSSYVIYDTFYPVDNQKLFELYFKPYNGTINPRGDSSTPFIGYEYYENQEFNKALDEFLKMESNQTGEIDLLIANCYLSLGNPQNAIKQLNRIDNERPQLIQQSRDWYLALSFLKIEDVDSSKKLLIKLSESESPYKSLASKILEDTVFD